jgi:glycosyltransferase involved in cell wall biosynthesis
MNNNFYILGKHLRRRGYNVHLLLNKDEYRFFTPDYDSFKAVDYSWIKRTNMGLSAKSYFLRSQREILSEYDFYITCGFAPAFLGKYGFKSHLFIPYGSDLYLYPLDYKDKNPLRRLPMRLMTYKLRRCIQQSAFISIIPTAPAFSQAIDKLGVKNKVLPLSIPLVDLKEWSPETVSNFYPISTIFDKFEKFRKNFDFVVFSCARHYWKCTDDPVSHKGNDKLIKGLAKAIRKVNVGLILTAKGPDVDASRSLIRELGIEQNVLWLSEVPRREIYVAYSLCDIAAIEFVMGGYGGSGLEAMSMGKPTMVYMGLDQKTFQEVSWRPFPPIVNVHTPGDIEDALLDFAERPDYYRKIGEASRRWIELFYGDGLVDKFEYLINTLSKGKEVDFSALRFDLKKWDQLKAS